jgi:hypothetical protein
MQTFVWKLFGNCLTLWQLQAFSTAALHARHWLLHGQIISLSEKGSFDTRLLTRSKISALAQNRTTILRSSGMQPRDYTWPLISDNVQFTVQYDNHNVTLHKVSWSWKKWGTQRAAFFTNNCYQPSAIITRKGAASCNASNWFRIRDLPEYRNIKVWQVQGTQIWKFQSHTTEFWPKICTVRMF